MRRRISLRQLKLLQFMAILPTTLVFLPGQAFEHARSGAFEAVGLALALGWVLNFIVTAASGGAGIARLMRAAWGKPLARFFLALYTIALGLGLVSVSNELFTFLQSSVLPKTPEWAVALLVWPTYVVLAEGGAVGLGRMAEILTLGAVFLGICIALPLVFYVRLNHFVPWLPAQASPVFQSAWLPATFVGETVIGVSFLDDCRETDPGRRKKALRQGALLSGAVLIGLVAVLWGVLGAGYAAELPFPILEAIREVRIGRFLSRLNLLFIPLWLALLELKLAIWVFAAGRAWHYAVPWGSRRLWLVVIGGVALMTAATQFPSVNDRIRFLQGTWGRMVFPFLFVLLLSSGLIARRKGASS